MSFIGSTRVETTPILGSFPVLGDIAVSVDEAVPAAQMEAVTRKMGRMLLVGIHLFDIYHGGLIAPGRKAWLMPSPINTLTTPLTKWNTPRFVTASSAPLIWS